MKEHRAALIVLSLVGGCSAASTKDAVSGVEGGKSINALSSEERRALCRWIVEQDCEQVSPEDLCMPRSVMRTSTKADCEDEQRKCVSAVRAEQP